MKAIWVSTVLMTLSLSACIGPNNSRMGMVEDEDTGFPTGREVWGTGDNPIKAKSEGNYSWLATFSPGETDSGSDPKQWTVSVAVFYKRPLSLGTASQWTVPIQGINSSTGGYTTVTLDGSNSTQIFEGTGTFDQDAGDKMKIKRRMWGLVSFTDGIDKRARWYRVGTVQKPIDGNNNIKIRLIGPDIPDAAQSLNITFFEGLEGVFTRAMMVGELRATHL